MYRYALLAQTSPFGNFQQYLNTQNKSIRRVQYAVSAKASDLAWQIASADSGLA